MIGRNRYHGKPDATLAPIKDALKAVGCDVLDLGAVGMGCADLLVYHPPSGLLRLLEAKSRTGKLNALQQAFSRRFPVWVVRTPDEALRAVGLVPAETK